MFELIRSVILWTFCSVYSIVIVLRLCVLYITKFSSQPWKPKDRPNAPAALTDPKYGVHKFATVNGIRLHYVESGDRTKPLMVFVHGFPEFWYCWRHQIVEFSKDYWVVAIDMRGYNLSERPSDQQNYEIQYMVDDLRALIEYLNRKKFILVAHDWGALVGWEFVAQNKQMIYKYVMMGAPSSQVFKKLFNSSLDQFKKSWYILLFQMPILPELMLSSDDFAGFAAVFNEFFNADDLEAYKYTFSKPGTLSAGINYYRANFGGASKVQKSDELDGTDGMFVLGEYERYISMDAIALTAKRYPKIRVEIVKDANHFLQQHQSHAVNELLREFLGSPADCSVEALI
ncbi:epoxide hydrolase 4-like [Contarinia nasturtii]|uniref:epoxide hydrolase 4-like n=1 Tax=Contarinia nasturtii TaxID=265458 RepID=UPI0012D3B66C|nr:epoxide hydrolase 4-like [Contarinia nasturtii]